MSVPAYFALQGAVIALLVLNLIQAFVVGRQYYRAAQHWGGEKPGHRFTFVALVGFQVTLAWAMFATIDRVSFPWDTVARYVMYGVFSIVSLAGLNWLSRANKRIARILAKHPELIDLAKEINRK